MHKKFVVYGEWERYIKAVEARLSDGAKLDKEDDLASHFVDTVTTPSILICLTQLIMHSMLSTIQ